MAKLGFPFTLGVASGEPSADGVILWTRLAVEPLHASKTGGMPNQAFSVKWELAEDAAFSRIVQSGAAPAQPDWAHSVHVRVSGLRAWTEYFYRFSVDGHTSPVGRTKTAPGPDSTEPIRIGVISCQRYEHGFFTVLKHLAAERPDVIFHLGDYVYEYGKPANPQPGRYLRPLESTEECKTLAAYRRRYARYQLDKDLQAAHAAAPWIAMPDDHEVRDNYAGLLPGDGSSQAAFVKRRNAAYKAYYEHLPLRVRPVGNNLQFYRWRPYGKVADFLFVDARQYRSGRNMLGTEQQEWLTTRLTASTARWKVLAQPLFFAPRKFPLEPPSADAWDGFPDSRAKVLAAATGDLVVLSGDVHNAWAAELGNGVEFVTSSVTSRPPSTDGSATLALNPHLKYFDGRRGYLMVTASMTDFTVDYRAVAFVDQPGAPVVTAAGFRVLNNKLQRTDL
ncbi:alkaline phosphatase D [Acrocarpospora corrugata]|uniref:Alkaline phosphatase D n=1 Tax=Acrocarpospora corrugata TaxID=35763 RepID=A0A5M3VU48_9ACTN|nr:alkaline phosphatase D family protein [Acrocarpospora corrugata]GES00096.1 alkaline phosphatase D [Acrocarpospora corrugata]